VKKPPPVLRCPKCLAFLADITVPNPPKHAPRLEQGCVACEGLLGPLDVVAQLFIRPADLEYWEKLGCWKGGTK